jgi:hypothetical protein
MVAHTPVLQQTFASSTDFNRPNFCILKMQTY